jgi:hypothetical protein
LILENPTYELSPTSTMNSLPTELQIAIASHLDDPTAIANYRLTNKRAAHIGAEFLFQVFTCRVSTATLDRMKHILASKYARFVHTIDYDGDGGDDARREHEMKVFASMLRNFGPRIAHLRATHLSLSAFSPRIRPGDPGFWVATSGLTTVELAFVYYEYNPVVPQNRLRKFTRGLERLSEVRLRLCKERFWNMNYAYGLGKVIDVTWTWPQLRKMEVGHVHVCGKDVVMLLRNHKATLESAELRCVALDVIKWDDRMRAWRNIWGTLGEMEKLQGGYVEEEVRLSEEEDASALGNGEIRDWRVKAGGEREVVIRTNLGKYLEGWKVR